VSNNTLEAYAKAALLRHRRLLRESIKDGQVSTNDGQAQAQPVEPTLMWIRTSEQLPPVGQEVLVWCDGPLGWGAMLDCWDEQHEALVDFSTITTPIGYGWNSGSEFERVSHWMAFDEPSVGPSRNAEAE
jgi:hypothetical protein